MDFLNFATTDACEEGVWVNIPDPRTGVQARTTDGTLSRIKIRGFDSNAYNEAMLEAQRELQKLGRPATDAEWHAIWAKHLAKIIIEWEGIGVGEEKSEFTLEKGALLLAKANWIRRLLNDKACEIDLFLPKRSAA